MTGWATGAVIRDLEHELEVLRSPEYRDLWGKGQELETLLKNARGLSMKSLAKSVNPSRTQSLAETLDMFVESCAVSFPTFWCSSVCRDHSDSVVSVPAATSPSIRRSRSLLLRLWTCAPPLCCCHAGSVFVVATF